VISRLANGASRCDALPDPQNHCSHLPPMLTTARDRSPAQSHLPLMTGAARKLLGLKDDPRLSRSRFRGCCRNSQIHRPIGHAVILGMMGWQPQNSNLPAQAVFLESGHEKKNTLQVLTSRLHKYRR
jgi:hypothetical protein